MSKIILLVASDGKNLDLAKTIQENIEKQEVKTELIALNLLELPLYTSLEEINGIPKNAKLLSKTLVDSRAIIIVAPEFNGSIPPVLNNAICWVSRSSKDWQKSFKGKVAAIATHSGSGGFHVLTAVRQQLYYLGMNVVGQQLITNYKQPYNEDIANVMIGDLLKLSR